MSVTEEPRWMQSSINCDYFYNIGDMGHGEPSNAEEALELLRKEYPEGGFQYGLASGTPLPKELPLDGGDQDEWFVDMFYEDAPSDHFENEFGELYEMLRSTYALWREKNLHVVGNVLYFAEGPFEVPVVEKTESSDDSSDAV